MRKNAAVITIGVIVAGIFGFFLRWLELMTAFEEGSGLPKHGVHAVSVIFAIYVIAAAAAAVVLGVLLIKKGSVQIKSADALLPRSGAVRALYWAVGLLFAVICLIVMMRSSEFHLPLLQRVFGALGILSGLAMPLAFASSKPSRSMGIISGAVMTVTAMVGLLYSYKANTDFGLVRSYAVEIVALSANVIAVAYISGFFFGCVKPATALCSSMLAAFLCMCTLSDSRPALNTLLILLDCAFLLLTVFTALNSGSDSEEGSPE